MLVHAAWNAACAFLSVYAVQAENRALAHTSTSRASGPIWLGHCLLRIGRGSMHIWHDALPVCGSVHARTRLLRQVPGHPFAEKQRPGFETPWLAWWLNRVGDWPAGPRDMCGPICTARWRRRMVPLRSVQPWFACLCWFLQNQHNEHHRPCCPPWRALRAFPSSESVRHVEGTSRTSVRCASSCCGFRLRGSASLVEPPN